jgi:hypothetical protein
MPITPTTIITVTDLGTYMNKPLASDTKAAQVVAAINAWVHNFTGRQFGTPIIATGEKHDYKPVIWTNHQDVISIEATRIGYPNQVAQTIPIGNYYFNEFGRIVLNPGGIDLPSRGNYDLLELDYTYGVATVPDDLKIAALALAADTYNDTGASTGAITMAMVGQMRFSYAQKDTYTPIFESYRTKRA